MYNMEIKVLGFKARVEVMRDQLEKMIVEKEKEIEQFEKYNEVIIGTMKTYHDMR